MERQLALARALALSWAAFWLVFFIAESWAWSTPVAAALPWIAVGALFVILALLPWRWDRIGGVLLLIAGVSAGLGYAVWAPPRLPVFSRALTTLVFAVPPLMAGVLFLRLHHR